MMRVLPIVVLTLLAVTASLAFAQIELQVTTEACSQYTRCSECVYDATSVSINRRKLVYCAWCPATQTCATSFGNSCPGNRTLESNNQCEDMQCAGAAFSGNIYMCRAGMVFAILFSVFLVLLAMAYAVWYRVIQQAPWRYANLDHALNKLIETHGGAWNASQKAAKPDILSADREYRICKKDRKQLTYDDWAFGCTDEERFWNQVKRYAFFPMAVAGITGAMCTVLLFSTSLRPYFADWYYALVLTAGYGSLLLMAVYVRLFQPPACHINGGDPQTYFDLAVFLHGRTIKNVFPIVDAKSRDAPTSPPTGGVSASGAAAAAAAGVKEPLAVVTGTGSGKHDNNDDDDDEPTSASAVAAVAAAAAAAVAGNSSSNNNNNSINTNSASAAAAGASSPLRAANSAIGTYETSHEPQPPHRELSPAEKKEARKTLASIASEYEMTPLGVDRKDQGPAFDQDEAGAAAASGFELDEGVPSDFRAKVSEIVKADEAILWFDAPDRNIVGIEYNWMYQLFFTGIGFSIFLYILSGVTPYPELLLPPSSLIVIALFLTLFCFLMLAVLSAGCKRIYLLTSQRLIVIARSITGTHNVNAIHFSDIKYCILKGYREMNHFVISVAWERATPAVRRMPKLQTDQFIAVSRLDTLLQLLIPRIASNALPPTFHDDLVHQRYVWRVHAAVNIAMFFLAPVVVLYSKVFPGGFGVIAMLLCMFVNGTVVHRAVRVLTTTVAPITVATGSVRTDASFSITKTVQYLAETLPMFIPDAIRRATGTQENAQHPSASAAAAASSSSEQQQQKHV